MDNRTLCCKLQSRRTCGQQAAHLDEIEDEPGGDALADHVDEEVGQRHGPDVGVLEHVVEQEGEERLLGLGRIDLLLCHTAPGLRVGSQAESIVSLLSVHE